MDDQDTTPIKKIRQITVESMETPVSDKLEMKRISKSERRDSKRSFSTAVDSVVKSKEAEECPLLSLPIGVKRQRTVKAPKRLNMVALND